MSAHIALSLLDTSLASALSLVSVVATVTVCPLWALSQTSFTPPFNTLQRTGDADLRF